jgi:hypothetical protein
VIRASGLAAILGGALRIVDAFTTDMLSRDVLAVLYFVTDVLLLAGVAGLWRQRRASLGVAGMSGLAVFVLGILAVRASALGFGTYQLGAAIALLGLAIYSVETLLRGSTAGWAPCAWLVSLVAGAAAAAGFQPLMMTALAGVAFGAGFVVAGTETLRA